MTFTLKGRPYGPFFTVVKEYKAAGFIPAVKGVTADGKFQTTARIVDVDFQAEE